MYQVFFDSYPLYDPRDERLVLREPEVHLEVGEAGEMSFLIDPDHPYADRLTRMKGIVELRADDVPIFKGRIRKDTRDFYLSREIEVEGLLACLNDSIIPPFNFPDDFTDDAGYQAAARSGNVIAFFLGWLLAQHNAQVGPGQQIQLGDVTVSDPNNYISRSSSDYLTTMEVVEKKLEKLLGGYLLADYSGETTVLHYYDDLPLLNVQEVEFGQNLLDLASELDSADTYTAILPIGKDGLTIENLSDGELSTGIWKQGRIIYSAEAEAAIGGRITRVVEWQDVTEDTNLQTKAASLLVTEGTRTAQTITTTALDLGVFGDAVPGDPARVAIVGKAVVGKAVVGVDDAADVTRLPPLMVGRYVRLTSAPHGFAEIYPLMVLEPDLMDPGNTKITLGSTVLTSTDLAHKNQIDTQEKLNEHQIQLNQQQGSIVELPQTFSEQITSAIQNSESIIFEALDRYVETSNFEEYQKTITAQLEILSSEISLKFTEAVEETREVDGDLQKISETLAKHFEFSADGLVIRAGENAMNLLLDNDMIRFMRNGQQFGWWDGVDFHTGNIVIDVNERAQFGNFAAIPRSSGNLSWLKVRG